MILLLDAALENRQRLARMVKEVGFSFREATTLDEATLLLADMSLGVAVVGDSTVIGHLHAKRPDLQVVVHAHGASARMVREAFRAGACDFFDSAAESSAVLTDALRRADERHSQVALRQELLRDARTLTEEGLQRLVLAERRDLELTSVDLTTPRALIVDREVTVRRSLRGILEADDVEVREMTGPVGLSAVLETDPPELVLMELHIPNASALTFLRPLQHQGRETVLLAPAGSPELSKSAEELGVSLILTKPVSDAREWAGPVSFLVNTHRRKRKAQQDLQEIRTRHLEYLTNLQLFRDALRSHAEASQRFP